MTEELSRSKQLARLQETAALALKEKGLDLRLYGPYPWKNFGERRIRAYITVKLPPAEHPQYFLTLPNPARGVMASTIVLLDVRGPTVLHVGSASDEA
jgi:hypothetical protein